MGAGIYVVAVSGGVDSMVLLDMLKKRPGLKLIVAHYDHGIRPNSERDRKLVQDIARNHSLPFVFESGKLGPKTSEATARTARYKFLEGVRKAGGARAIMTAHHQDDVLETAVINLLRGSGRRGLTALRSTDDIVRPLLDYDKEQIYEYAKKHALKWHEDPTNTDTKYLRNYIRARVLPKFSPGQRAQLLILIDQLHAINREMDAHIAGLLHIQPALDKLDRSWLIHLPHDVAKEVVHSWLKRHEVADLNKKMVERLIVAMKTGRPGQSFDVDKKHKLHVSKENLALIVRTDGRLPQKK